MHKYADMRIGEIPLYGIRLRGFWVVRYSPVSCCFHIIILYGYAASHRMLVS